MCGKLPPLLVRFFHQNMNTQPRRLKPHTGGDKRGAPPPVRGGGAPLLGAFGELSPYAFLLGYTSRNNCADSSVERVLSIQAGELGGHGVQI